MHKKSNSDLSVRLKVDCPSGNGILRMPGKRIATSLALLAMTVILFAFRTKLGAFCNEKYVIANQSADWCGNPFPRNA